MPTSGYDYGPPVAQVGTGWENRTDTSGSVTVLEPGEAPHDPPPDATIVQEPGGSPSKESTAPLTIVTQVDGLAVTLLASGPGAAQGCEVLWGDGSGPVYPGLGGTSGYEPITYEYGAGGDYTISVDPLGEMFPPTTANVTVVDPNPPAPPEE